MCGGGGEEKEASPHGLAQSVMVCAVLALILQGTIFPRVSQRQNGSTVGLNADLENSLQRVESTMMGCY